jgi:hypothetical protein
MISADTEIAYYQGLSLKNLKKIKPCWACGPFMGMIFIPAIHPKKQKRFVTFQTDLHKLMSYVPKEEIDVSALFNGEPRNDRRVAHILNRWHHKQFIDPPTIGIRLFEGPYIDFQDGRHRTKVAFLLGCTSIPVAIEKDEFDEMKKIIPLRTV